MIRRVLASLLLTLCLCSPKTAAGCTAWTGKESKADVLRYLQRERGYLEKDCVWKAVAADVGKGDLDFARAFIALLDYSGQEIPSARKPVVANKQVAYPAISGLMMVGKLAQPLVLEALTSETSNEDTRKNAAVVVYLLNRTDLIEGARQIAAAYWGVADQAIAKQVLDAAVYASRSCGPEKQAICQAEIFKKPVR